MKNGKILDGKKIAETIQHELKSEVKELNDKNIHLGLAVIIVGENSASKVYVENKKRTCQELGIQSYSYELPETITQNELLQLILTLNKDPNVNGILVQLPLPSQIDEKIIIEAIAPEKDVDCFHPYNIGKMFASAPIFLPCTPAGIIEILMRSEIEIEGTDCVVVGKSNIVGKPLAVMLANAGATVSICHSKTKELSRYCQSANILISAVGKPNLIKANMVRPGAVVIDVGINRLDTGKLVGDVDFDEVKKIASAITPVPGGVGPMTIAMLMKNVVAAAQF